jgi:aminoglycoside phosphotransferase (APT) family kinase protein
VNPAHQVARGVLISASRDPDAKLTFVVTDGGTIGAERLAVKIPATAAAGSAVDREGRMLVEIRRLGLGPLGPTVPRYVESLDIEGRPVLVSTAVAGTSMAIAYHRWAHTARASRVSADFAAAFGWLGAFQARTSRAPAPVDWPVRVLDAVRGRWDGHRSLPAAVARLELAAEHLSGQPARATAVHGDFWFGNLLVDRGAVSGVVDWEAAAPVGCPLRDPARFVLSYALYLDRHTRPGRLVLGHPGLRRTGFAPGIRYALSGSGWFPELARGSLCRHLVALELSPHLWYDVALTGIGEVAAFANSDDFGAGHLDLLAGLPARPRRPRR